MAEINLLKDSSQSKKSYTLEGPTKSIALSVTIGLLVLEAALYGGLFWYHRNQDNKIVAADRRASEVNLEISKTSTERKEAISYQNRLKTLGTLLDHHLFWTAMMAELERVSLKTAIFTEIFYVPGETQISLGGRVSSYTELASVQRTKAGGRGRIWVCTEL